MKFSIFSDLHYEMQDIDISTFRYAAQNTDIIILAGDVVNSKTYYMLGAIRSLVPRYIPILFTPGNHEYYGAGNLREHRTMLRKYCAENDIVFLDREVFEFHGHLFIGATGWSDLQAPVNVDFTVEEIEETISHRIADFEVIGNWSIEKMKIQSNQDKHFIKTKLKEARQEKLAPVVVTHFPPLKALDHPSFHDNKLTSYFVNNWEDTVSLCGEQNGTWIYGHTHGNHPEVVIHGTRFLCNMHGYPRESYDECVPFDKYKIFETSE